MIVWHDHYRKPVFFNNCRHITIITQSVRFCKMALSCKSIDTDDFLTIRSRQEVIFFQKIEEQRSGYTFVPIYKRMVFDNEVKENRGFVLNGGIEVSTGKTLIHLANRAVETVVFVFSKHSGIKIATHGLNDIKKLLLCNDHGRDTGFSACFQGFMIVFVKYFQTLGKIREHFNDAPGLVYCFDVIQEAAFYYADRFFEFLNLFLLFLQALLIDGVALNQMFLENSYV